MQKTCESVTAKSEDAALPLGASGQEVIVQHGNAPLPSGAFLAILLLLAGCCMGGNPDCIGFPAPWLWGVG